MLRKATFDAERYLEGTTAIPDEDPCITATGGNTELKIKQIY